MPPIILKVEVEGDHIVITQPGFSFRTAYFKSPDEPRLIQSPAMSIDKGGQVASREFEALAWEAANEKARALGWL